MTGLFYIVVAVGIVFVVWAYANEKRLIAIEDKLWAAIKAKFNKHKKR